MSRLFWQAVLLLVFLFTAALISDQSTSNTNSDVSTLPVFTDVTREAGMAYKITCGDEVTEYLIDVNGQGAAFFEYDNDVHQYIYLVNGSCCKSITSRKMAHE